MVIGQVRSLRSTSRAARASRAASRGPRAKGSPAGKCMTRECDRRALAGRELGVFAHEAAQQPGARPDNGRAAQRSDRYPRFVPPCHHVQIACRHTQQSAVGRVVAGKGMHGLVGRPYVDRCPPGGREPHTVAFEHREPALDAGKHRERPGRLDVGHADAHGPMSWVGPAEQRARPPAAIGPGLGHDLRRMQEPHGRFNTTLELAVVGTPVRYVTRKSNPPTTPSSTTIGSGAFSTG